MNALIIGGAGFVGPYLAKAVKKNLGCDVVVTKLPHENFELEGAAVEDLNILEPEQIQHLLEKYKPEYIFHLAAQSSVALSWKKPGLTVDINVKGALNLFDEVRKLDYKPAILVIGSGEEYGHIDPKAVPLKETEVVHPGNIYAATKACQNMISKIYTQAYGMNIITTRSFNHMGPGQLPIFVMADFCRQVALIENGEQKPVMKVGNLSARRDFTDVRDVVNAYTAIIQKGKAGETYNVGTGKAIAIEDLLKMIVDQSNVKITIEVDQAKLRPVDVPLIEPDITKLVEATGWKPVIPTSQTIHDTLNYWREQVKAGKI